MAKLCYLEAFQDSASKLEKWITFSIKNKTLPLNEKCLLSDKVHLEIH